MNEAVKWFGIVRESWHLLPFHILNEEYYAYSDVCKMY